MLQLQGRAGALMLAISCLVSQPLTAGRAAAEPPPLTMAVIGDSISFAALADTALGGEPAWWDNEILQGAYPWFAQVSFGAFPEGEGALNERYMRFVRQVTERPHLSGILGTQPYAIPFRLEAHTGRAVIPVDLTGGGLSYRRLGHHLEQIGARLALLAPDLLVVNLGAIDFAMGDPSSLFRDNVRAGLARVAALAPATRLLVTGVPDVVSVLRMADVPARRGGDGTVISCGRLHRAARLGLHTGLVGDEPGPEQVAAEYARQRAYEQILSEAVDEIAAAGYAGRIRYVPSRFPIHPEYLGTDCLHPNQRGHAELAAHYWPAVVALLGD